ncbi:MAG: FG-GAP repeat protein [Phycisphaerales bacterium]|nr:FG-GAP repeat protein [Phycisphaerales bacterium]
MSLKLMLPIAGASALAAATIADPLIFETAPVPIDGVEGLHTGWATSITDTSVVDGTEALMFVSSPSYRLMEYDPQADPPVQPIPQDCFPNHPRVLNMLGLWPEGAIQVSAFDGDEWVAAGAFASPFGPSQAAFGTAWGYSISTTPNGEYLLVGSTTAPGVHSKIPLGLDCQDDFESIPGLIIPRGIVDLYRFDGVNTWNLTKRLGPHPTVFPTSDSWVLPSGQPSALCGCNGEVALSTSQNGLGWSTDLLTFDHNGREKVLLISGIPWFDGHGAYPAFAAVNLPDGTSIVAEVDTHAVNCCVGTNFFPEIPALDCGRLGGVIVGADVEDCVAASACCMDDTCMLDTDPVQCALIGGVSAPGELCEDEPCPIDGGIDLGFSDPTACGRGGAYLAMYDPLDDSLSPVVNALDVDGNEILPAAYDVGNFGLIPDPLIATGDPVPHQVMGYSVDISEEDGVIWIAVGSPFLGGVTGMFAAGLEPECEVYYNNNLDIGPLNGRVLMFSLDPDTMTVQHRQTLTATDAHPFAAFGASVSLSGGRLVVGAPRWQSPTNSGGAAYIFEMVGTGVWAETDRLHPQDNANGANFGYSVALHEDKLAVGSPLQGTLDGAETGAVHRFNYDPTTDTWDETETLLPPTLGTVRRANPGEQHWGRSVSITDRFVVGGGPHLFTANETPFGTIEVDTGGAGVADARPIPSDPPPPPLCSGDVTDDNHVDIRDIIVMLKALSQPAIYPQCDLNDDTQIDVFDLLQVVDRWGQSCW